MKITIKTIRNVVVSNLVMLGLAACSSSPAPWTQVDDSPWSSKRTAESEILSNDVSSMTDPVLLGDPEPAVIIEESKLEPVAIDMQPETVVVEPAIVEPVVVESNIVAQSTEQELLDMPASNYAVQVYAANSINSVEKFKNKKNVYELKTVSTVRSGSIVYVLVDVYSDRSSANAAAIDLADRTGEKPWIRSLAGLQKVIAQ